MGPGCGFGRSLVVRGMVGCTLAMWGSALAGCDRGASGGAEIVKAPIVAEMRTILRDVRMAQERAAIETGSYVGQRELGRYLDRAVPSNYRLEVSDASSDAYRARVEHGPSGLECDLHVRPGGPGSPRCD